MDYTKYHYEELVKLLVVLSSDAETQLKACGIGNAEDELAIDLETYFTENKEQLVNESHLSPEVASDIEELDRFFEARSGNDDDGFWTGIETHGDWNKIRDIAGAILKRMGKDKLSVDIQVENKYG